MFSFRIKENYKVARTLLYKGRQKLQIFILVCERILSIQFHLCLTDPKVRSYELLLVFLVLKDVEHLQVTAHIHCSLMDFGIC